MAKAADETFFPSSSSMSSMSSISSPAARSFHCFEPTKSTCNCPSPLARSASAYRRQFYKKRRVRGGRAFYSESYYCHWSEKKRNATYFVMKDILVRKNCPDLSMTTGDYTNLFVLNCSEQTSRRRGGLSTSSRSGKHINQTSPPPSSSPAPPWASGDRRGGGRSGQLNVVVFLRQRNTGRSSLPSPPSCRAPVQHLQVGRAWAHEQDKA